MRRLLSKKSVPTDRPHTTTERKILYLPAYVAAERPSNLAITVVVERIEVKEFNERKFGDVWGRDRSKTWSWSTRYDIMGHRLHDIQANSYAGPRKIFYGFVMLAAAGRVIEARSLPKQNSQKQTYDNLLRERILINGGRIEDLSPGDLQWYNDLGRDWGNL